MKIATYKTHADLGGQTGHGPVQIEPQEPLFHAPWEPRVLALTLAAGALGRWNIDMSRRMRETLPAYAALSYYEIWFEALCKLLVAHGLLTSKELAEGRVHRRPDRAPARLEADRVAQVLAKGSPTQRQSRVKARFAVGDRVRLYAGKVPHHTRLPAYVRGKVGTIERVHGVHVFADAHASGRGESPQWLYTVVVPGKNLWPGPADAAEASACSVSVDAWEPYLEPAR